MASFASAVMLGDLSDFIAPSQACVNPIFVASSDGGGAAGPGQPKIGLAIESDVLGTTGYTEPNLIHSTAKDTAQVSLSDCLACSGCVTSAETVLIQQQSLSQFHDALKPESPYDLVVVTLSSQTRASLAAHFGLGTLELHRKLATFLRRLGVGHVFDSSCASMLARAETKVELLRRLRSGSGENRPPWTAPAVSVARSSTLTEYPEGGGEAASDEASRVGPLPLLASACPGWVCYAEKTHPEALPYISTVKSPQQIMGVIVKNWLARALGHAPSRVFHVALMPCPDKKLEASRLDFFEQEGESEGASDVDCVLTSTEVLDLINDALGSEQGGDAAATAAFAALDETATEAAEAWPAASNVAAGLTDKTPSAADLALLGRALRADRSGLGEVAPNTLPRGAGEAGWLPGVHSALFDSGAPTPSKRSRGNVVRGASARAQGEKVPLAISQSTEGEGFLDELFRHAAFELYGVEVKGPLQYMQGRNRDLQTVTLHVNGSPALRFAAVYGFRNIQAVVRQLKRGKCPYHYVEVMACPGGCLNGGGQISPSLRVPAADPGGEGREPTPDPAITAEGDHRRARLRDMDTLMVGSSQAQGPVTPALGGTSSIGELTSTLDFRRSLRTRYHVVPKLSNPLLSKW